MTDITYATLEACLVMADITCILLMTTIIHMLIFVFVTSILVQSLQHRTQTHPSYMHVVPSETPDTVQSTFFQKLFETYFQSFR